MTLVAAAQHADRDPVPDREQSFLAAALTAGALSHRTVPVEHGELDCLLPAVAPLLDEADRRLAAALVVGNLAADIDAAAQRALREWLGARLTRCAARTLVFELHRDGGTFDRFVAATGTPAGLRTLFADYPVLRALLVRMCLSAVDAVAELAARLHADRAGISAALLGGGDATVVSLRLGAGDVHRRGRAVAIVECASGRVVYKPRPLEAAARLPQVFALLGSRRPDLALRAPRTLRRDGYGWEEHVAAAPCADAAALQRFHLRHGALLALMHVLDATDLHCQNVVACGEHPVVVDAETLFHPTVLSPDAADDPATTAHRDSVLRTGLLPLLVRGRHGLLDLSGLLGGRAAATVDDVVRWRDAGTGRMRLERARAALPSSDNAPWIEGEDPAGEPDDAFAGALLAGFRAAYTELLGCRDELAALVGSFADDEVRVVLRPTQLYASLLDEATHPDLLRDPERHEAALASVIHPSDPAVLHGLAGAELDDLRAGDVPLFVARAGGRELRTTTPGHPSSLLDVAGTDRALGRLAAASPADLQRQTWFIEAALAGRGQEIEHRRVPRRHEDRTARPAEPDQVLAQACGIADELLSTSTTGPGGRVNWVGLEPADGLRWELRPLGAGLADGYSGVAVFLADLGSVTGITRYLDHARAAISPLGDLLYRLAADPGLAAAVGDDPLVGLRGVETALAALTTLLGEPTLADWRERCRQLRALLPGGAPRSTTPAAATWCAGVPGLLTAPPERAGVILAQLREDGPLDQQSLCHGELGVLETLRLFAAGEGGACAAADALRRERLALVMGDLATRGVRCGTVGAVRTPGLLHGTAGIGLALVNQSRADAYPSGPTSLDLLRAVRPEPTPQEETR